jgi:hypothetical protein
MSFIQLLCSCCILTIEFDVIVEIGDSPLIFVIKLDEAEIVHSQKLECVSITLMNPAIDKTS